MNFTYTLTKPPDGNWGAIQPDGSWNGMVNLLAKQDIDIAATSFTITHERSAVITFATPLTQVYYSLFIKNPADTFNYMAYIEPMHWLSWIGILILIFFAPPLLCLTTR
jgi:ionotropic kainate glutamate receptor 5